MDFWASTNTLSHNSLAGSRGSPISTETLIILVFIIVCVFIAYMIYLCYKSGSELGHASVY